MIGTDSGRVTLSWKAPSNNGGSPVTGYILQAAPAGSKDFSDVGKVDGNTLQYEVKGLNDGQEYMFKLEAENEAGKSKNSVQLEKSVKAAAPISK